ncbi:EamA domain-containing membrane protein RarD [Lutibacter oricola]|uniref:EamA domain-containing membrane protein RarD n=1 Tax=Lutibacter oricola TaxID=762486 RepID=A0A1H3AF40_9FLAO|nr:EamA family transporter [Lutibacter oricola]SDX28263.1 EamA domain-containing membrane protein RarD [Lutibacter oricola]
MSTAKLNNYLHLHFIVFIWGFTAILGALISIDAIPLVWYRMLFAVIFTVGYFLIKKKSLKIPPKAIIKFVIGGVIIATHWVAFFSAIKVSNVSVALVSLSTGALFTSLLEPLFFKRRINPLEFIFGLIVISGLYLIFNVEGEYALGIIYALIAAFLSALFSVLNGLYVKQYDAEAISLYQLLFGVLFITVFVFATTGFNAEDYTLNLSDFSYILILSSICTAYAFIVSVRIMKYLTPYTVMLTINLEPIYAIILALIIFGEKEQMSFEFYIGAVIIILTVIANGIIKNKKKRIN